MKPPVLLLAARQCDQCLLRRNRIVSGERAAGIIKECRAKGTHFRCHKSNKNLHCRGMHDRYPSTAYRIARAFGIEIRELET